MIDVNLLKDILTNLGIPGVIVSIIIILVKSKPITLISASSIEMRLVTKERRFFINSIRVIFEVLLYVLILMLFTEQFFKNQNLFNPYLANGIFIVWVGVFFWLLIMDLLGKNFENMFSNRTNFYKGILFFVMLIYLLGWFLIPSYYIGTNLYSEFYNDQLAPKEQMGVLIATLIIYLVIVIAIYLPVLKTIYRFIGLSLSIDRNFSIRVDDKIWFIHHQVEDDLFLLGNSRILGESKEITFIEKSKLLESIIFIDNN